MLAIALASLFIVLAVTGALSPETVSERVDEFGWAGPFVFIVVSVILTCAMCPGPILAGAAGLLFGTALGTPVALVSATLGASLACVIGRFVAGDAVEEIGGPRIKRARDLGRRTRVTLRPLRALAPACPTTLVNYACGLTTIPIGVVAAATAIGTAPRTFAYVALGGSFGDFSSPAAIVAIVIIVGMGLIGLALIRRDFLRSGPRGRPRRRRTTRYARPMSRARSRRPARDPPAASRG